MNDLFSKPIDQLGIVVPNLEVAITEWLKLGIGPFLTVCNVVVTDYEYRGKPSKPILDIGLAQKDHMQIELIHQINDEASAYRDFIAAGGNGFHHFGWFCNDYAGTQVKAQAANTKVLQRGGTGIKFVYYEITDPINPPSELSALGERMRTVVSAACASGTTKIAELIELNDMSRAMFGFIREQASKWDGKTEPVRKLMSPV